MTSTIGPDYINNFRRLMWAAKTHTHTHARTHARTHAHLCIAKPVLFVTLKLHLYIHRNFHRLTAYFHDNKHTVTNIYYTPD